MLNPEASQTASPSRCSYAFLSNVKALKDAAELQLVQGHQLRRANAEETVEIKDTIARLAGFTHPHVSYLWEAQLPSIGPLTSLPATAWRYFVMTFQGPGKTLIELQDAFDLAEVELEIAFTIDHCPEIPAGVAWHLDRLVQTLRRAQSDDNFFVEVDRADAVKITTIHTQLWRNDDPLIVNLRPVVRQLGQLNGLNSPPLCFLGYFAILESLLSHNPRPEDRYDSITRQIKKKLALLDNRWSQRINYSPFDGPPEKIWTSMYAYRSLVAHGGVADFNKVALKVLKGHAQALTLIKNTTKAVIRQALVEPRLLLDLKDC